MVQVEAVVSSFVYQAEAETQTDQIDPSGEPARRIAVLVLGMHRSGTSATTRVINLLGADLPSNLMPPAEGNNEAGFWESLDLVALNDKILNSAGSHWADWRRFHTEWFRSPVELGFKRRALELLERDFAASSLFVLKDPRMCRLLPFWLEALQDFGAEVKCVLPLRNPLEVAASLYERDGFSPAQARLLWLRHVLDAEFETRGRKRAFLLYGELLQDWRGNLVQVANRLGLGWPRLSVSADADIDVFLEQRHRHHVIEDSGVFEDPELGTWVKEVYAGLLELTAHPESSRAQGRLDGVRTELDRANDALGPMFDAEIEALDVANGNLTERIGELEQAVAAHKAHALALEQVVSERERKIGELDQSIAAHRAQAEALEQVITERDALIASLQTELDGEYAKMQGVSLLKRQLLSRLDAIQSSASWQLSGPARVLESRSPRIVRGIAAIPKLAWWTLTWRLPKRLRVRRLATALLEAGLFDRPWYLEQNPDLVLDGRSPVLYWLVEGWTEGRDPNPLFDTDWYLAQNPDVAAAGVNPLVHYLERGATEGRDPHPSFDTDSYLQTYPEVKLSKYNPLSHYLLYGRSEGRLPRGPTELSQSR